MSFFRRSFQASLLEPKPITDDEAYEYLYDLYADLDSFLGTYLDQEGSSLYRLLSSCDLDSLPERTCDILIPRIQECYDEFEDSEILRKIYERYPKYRS